MDPQCFSYSVSVKPLTTNDLVAIAYRLYCAFHSRHLSQLSLQLELLQTTKNTQWSGAFSVTKMCCGQSLCPHLSKINLQHKSQVCISVRACVNQPFQFISAIHFYRLQEIQTHVFQAHIFLTSEKRGGHM